MKLALLRGVLAIGTAAACGSPPPAAVPSWDRNDPPPLDCSALTTRITTCADAFEAAYARTEDAARRGASAPGAPGNGVAGATTLMRLYRDPAHTPLAEQLCRDAWAARDPAWRRRLQACPDAADCSTWAACAAPAIGDPLPPPDHGAPPAAGAPPR